MLIRELLSNPNFDVNCNYTIYDCRSGNKTWDDANILFSTLQDNEYDEFPTWIFNLSIGYITVDVENKSIVIEAI